MRRQNIPINGDAWQEGLIMVNPFKRDKEITAKEKERKEKQDERRQRAQARGQKPIK
jgi:hypothetical protein